MKAMLVIQTSNGFAVAPYGGSVPDNFVQSMQIATEIKSYGYADQQVVTLLKEYFDLPAEVIKAPTATAEEPL